MNIDCPTKQDIEGLRAAVAFSNSDQERRNAQEKLDLALKLFTLTERKVKHRPTERGKYKFEAMCFVEEMEKHWEKLRWDRRTPLISKLAVDSCVGKITSTNAKRRLIKGLEFCLSDRECGDIALDAIELLKLESSAKN